MDKLKTIFASAFSLSFLLLFSLYLVTEKEKKEEIQRMQAVALEADRVRIVRERSLETLEQKAQEARDREYKKNMSNIDNMLTLQSQQGTNIQPAPNLERAVPNPERTIPLQLSGPVTNAIRSARSYLRSSGFSREGLIKQLSSEYGSGYSLNDATSAVDSLNVDWDEQAVKSARSYLRSSGFSCDGLIKQLSSSAGSNFTMSQATYGAQQAGACNR